MTRPNILYVVHRFPYPLDKGDRIRAYHLIEFLAERADLHVACLADEPVEKSALAAIRPFCKRLEAVRVGYWRGRLQALGSLARGGTATEGVFRSPALSAVIRSWSRDTRFDVGVASSSGVAGYLEAAELKGTPAIVDFVDVDSQKWLDYATATRPPRAWLCQLEGRRLRRREAQISSWAKAVAVVSDSEAAIYREVCPDGPVRVIGNGVDLDYFRPRDTTMEATCVFVGALDYRPNVEGVIWFCREVWPEVRSRRPEARFWIVGRRPVAAIRSLAQIPGVEVIGPVADVRPYLAKAAAAMAPLQIARGVQNKALEALAMGKATVVSTAAAAGLGAVAGTHFLAARCASEWVEAILRLLNDAALRNELGSAGRRYVEEHRHWDQCLAALGDLLAEVLGAECETGHRTVVKT